MSTNTKLSEALRRISTYPHASDSHVVALRNIATEALAAAPAQQPAGQEQDERAAFEAWFSGFRHGWKSEKEVASDAWRAALAQRMEPLTDEQISMIGARALDKCLGTEAQHVYLAREVERAHGIGATTGLA